MEGMSRDRAYGRLTRIERVVIERGLDSQMSIRKIAGDIARSPSKVASEVMVNRYATRGRDKGQRVTEIPEGACPRLLASPYVCNVCRFRRYHCNRPWRCEYSALRADALASASCSVVREGVWTGLRHSSRT